MRVYIPKVVCSRCGQAMKCEKNGVLAEALTAGHSYYKIECDKYRCPSCGVEVLTGFARDAVSEHFKTDYASHMADEVFELN